MLSPPSPWNTQSLVTPHEPIKKQAINCDARTYDSGLYEALHMCYSLTSVGNWLTEILSEVVTPQQPNVSHKNLGFTGV